MRSALTVQSLAVLFLLSWQPVFAQSVAATVYEQCTGPAFEDQVERKYRRLPCQFDDSCEPIYAYSLEKLVETECFGGAVDICILFDDANACTLEIVESFSHRTSLLAAEFSERRAEAALSSKDGFARRNLERILDNTESETEQQCFDYDIVNDFAEAGILRTTTCAIYRALNASSNAFDLKEATLRAEAEAE